MTIEIEMGWTAVGIAAALLASAFGGFAWLWGRLDKKFEKIDTSMKEMKIELKADIAADMTKLESSLKADMTKLESSLKADMTKLESSLKADIAKVESSLKEVQNSLRSDISKAELWVINLFGIVNRPLPIERPAQGE